MTPGRRSDGVTIAILMMLVTYLLFAMLDTTTKWLLGAGVPALQLAFLRYAGHFVISLSIAGLDRRAGPVMPRSRFWLLLVRSGVLVVATAGNFFVLTFLPLTITSAIMFTAPIIVCVLSMSVLGERVGVWRWSAIVLGFIGVLFVIRPFGESFHAASFLALFNAFCMALYSLLTRKMAGEVSARTMQFFSGAVGTIALAPFALLVWVPPASGLVLTLWAGLGIAGWCGHELLTRAHALAPANTLMPFSYSLLVYMTLFDIALFGQIPQGSVLTGIGIIVVAGLIIWKRGATVVTPVPHAAGARRGSAEGEVDTQAGVERR